MWPLYYPWSSCCGRHGKIKPSPNNSRIVTTLQAEFSRVENTFKYLVTFFQCGLGVPHQQFESNHVLQMSIYLILSANQVKGQPLEIVDLTFI